jgi:hypothetical protein
VNKNGVCFIFLTILVTSAPTIASTPATASSASVDRLRQAASYLLEMYNPRLGLIANSEDKGLNPLGDEGVPCTNTYWIYSDNLWAGWALQPYDAIIAENVSFTVQGYIDQHGLSMLFEAAIGEPIPTTIHANKNIKVFDDVVNGDRVQVLLDRHQFADNPGVFDDAEEYADLCFYLTINYWMMNDTGAATHWFRRGEAWWNTTTNYGFYDKATQTVGRYQNYKLGLFLLTQRATGFSSNITDPVEMTAWSYQNALGGITTQSWLNGSRYGTANTEATAALLLAYNNKLTDRLHKNQTYADYLVEVLTAQVNNLREENTWLREEIGVFRDSPWLVRPLPPWLIILVGTTLVSTTFSCILIARGKRRRMSPQDLMTAAST